MTEDEGTADRLPDEAAVIRDGYMRFKNFEISTDNHYEHYTEYALSVFCLPECTTGEEVAHEVARHCPEYSREVFRESKVGPIRTIGYDVVPDEPPYGHALIKLPPSKPSKEDYRKLNEIFAKAKTNPYYEEES